MTFEEAVDCADALGLYVANVSVGMDEKWRCSLRRKLDLPFVHSSARTVYVQTGIGASAAEAISSACYVQQVSVSDQFEDLLG